jgi:hypothetical protein
MNTAINPEKPKCIELHVLMMLKAKCRKQEAEKQYLYHKKIRIFCRKCT